VQDAAAEAVDREQPPSSNANDTAKQRKQKAEAERDTVSAPIPLPHSFWSQFRRRRYPLSRSLIYAQGNDLFRKGKFSEAAECYTRAMELDPSSALLPANRAMCYLKLNKPSQAEADATRSIELDPSYAKGYYRRAMARKELHKYKLALDDLNKVLELEPSSKQALDEKQKVSRLLVPPQEKLEPRVAEVDAPPAVAVIVPPSSAGEKKEPSAALVGQAPAPKTAPQPTPAPARAPPKVEERPAPTLVAVPLKLELPETPTTFFEFSAAWASLETAPELRAKLLAMIPAANLGALFKGSVNPSLLGSILQVLASHTLQFASSSCCSLLV